MDIETDSGDQNASGYNIPEEYRQFQERQQQQKQQQQKLDSTGGYQWSVPEADALQPAYATNMVGGVVLFYSARN